MKELSLKEIQQASLQVLIEIDKICEEQGLRYYLAYGTLIGAVRHHGFIPWDDDIDIMMPRKDFRRLIRYFNTQYRGKLKLCTRENTKNYTFGIPRIADTTYKYISTRPNTKAYKLGVFIDVYPLDNYGNNAKIGSYIYKLINIKNRLYDIYINPTFAESNWKIPFKYIVYMFLRLIKGKDYSKKINKEILNIIKKFTNSNDKYVGIPSWDIGKMMQYNRHLFNHAIKLEFEGKLFPAPNGYHKILTQFYGDYMKLPPIEKRVSNRHQYKIYKDI